MVFTFNNNFDVSDLRLIGNPQITFFKSVYRRHTPFSIIERKLSRRGDDTFDLSFMEGDLLKSVKLQMSTTTFTDVIPDNIGTTILDYISFYVNDKKIEELKGEFIEMYMQMNNPMSPQTFYSASGSTLELTQGTMAQFSFSGGVFNPYGITASNIDISLPIPFSFCLNNGNMLPTFLFAKSKNVYIKFNIKKDYVDKFTGLGLVCEKIFISENEKMRFRTSNNEYIHQSINTLEIDRMYNRITPSFGTIAALYWKNEISKNYKYNIEISNFPLISNPMSYHYFSRQSLLKSGYVGNGRKSGYVNNASMVVNNDSICMYNFGLKDINDYIGDIDNVTPSGSISVNKNNVRFIVENFNGTAFNLYIKSYNILNISENEIYLRYVH
jgi:hypothetical protein